MGRKLRVLDLFSGIGGFSLGLERATMEGAEYDGFETVAFCEIEEFPRKVLAKHWPDVPCYRDVRELTAERLAADGIAVDVITGGFPCQDLSIAGLRRGLSEGTRSGLFSEIARLIGELRPRYVILENVANLLSGPDEQPGGWFGHVLGTLAECGYDAEWENIPASTLGAPHPRERIWIVAYPHGTRLCRWPASIDSGEGWPGREEQFARLHEHCIRMAIPARSHGRIHDGVPDRVGQLKCYGNAVVPQIPELIGRAILAAQNATIRGDKRDGRKHSDWLEGYDAVAGDR